MWFLELVKLLKQLIFKDQQLPNISITPQSAPNSNGDSNVLDSTKLSFEDTEIIRQFEGHSLKAYPDPATKGDPYTISYGLTGPWVVKGLEITQDESNSKFMEYIRDFSNKLDSLLRVTLTKNQYMAVLSLMWNIGPSKLAGSTLLRVLNQGDYNTAANEFLKWDKAAGKVMAGLTKRRALERELFLKA